MFRRFDFEKDVYAALEFVPMSVRRKLDLVGVKIHLNEWRTLSLTERLVVCHFPTASSEEREVLGAFLREAVKRRTGTEIAAVNLQAEENEPNADRVPADVSRLISEFQLSDQEWIGFDPDERFALSKLARGPADKFRSAWAESGESARRSMSKPPAQQDKEKGR